MKRREFILSRAVVWPLATFLVTAFWTTLVWSQPPDKRRRVAVVTSGVQTDPVVRQVWQALVDGLRKHGWEEGRNVVLEGRFAGPGAPARYHELAAELVALKVDVIVCGNSQATEAARRKTATIPVVMVNVTDPVFGEREECGRHREAERLSCVEAPTGQRDGLDTAFPVLS